MYGIYVILHGHLSPGGGFAGGTIISAGMIFYKLVYPERSKRVISKDLLIKSICGAITTYGLLKTYHIVEGIMSNGHGLHARPASHTIASGGALVVLNVCVGIIVACTFYSIFSLFMEGEL
jgi:multicomponent Na+:H+ antiporter subunit B